MALIIQTPFEGSSSILESIEIGAKDAVFGAGSYAFATEKGVRLFFENANIIDFFKNLENEFYLLIGTDEITNSKTIKQLKVYEELYPNLTVRLFYHSISGLLFHPKFSWFKKADNTGALVMGSGNLTQTGLYENWEGFLSLELDEASIDDTIKNWNYFLEEYKDYILSLDNPLLINKAKSNDKKRNFKEKGDKAKPDFSPNPQSNSKRKRLKTATTLKQANVIKQPVENINGSPRIFIRLAMQARGKGDYSQILFGKDVYDEFFGFDLEEIKGKFSYGVYDNRGFVGEVINASITVKKSRNYGIGIASLKQGMKRSKADPAIKSNFMVESELIKNEAPINLVLKIGDQYKVLFTHPSKGMKLLHQQLKSLLGSNKEKILKIEEVNMLIAHYSEVENLTL